jgi:hypothetical protein
MGSFWMLHRHPAAYCRYRSSIVRLHRATAAICLPFLVPHTANKVRATAAMAAPACAPHRCQPTRRNSVRHSSDTQVAIIWCICCYIDSLPACWSASRRCGGHVSAAVTGP